MNKVLLDGTFWRMPNTSLASIWLRLMRSFGRPRSLWLGISLICLVSLVGLVRPADGWNTNGR